MKNLKWISIILVIFLAILGGYLIFFESKNGINTNIEVVADQLEVPWAIDFLPNGTLIFTERAGRVNLIINNQVVNVGNVNTTASGEGGLLGIAVDPKFDQNKYIYVYYTKGNVNRVARFILLDRLENETVILDNIPASENHNGGRIKFGPEGMLYITTGDAQSPQSAQDINSLSGKILRINSDGSIPLDNPFNNPVYSYGHRNPQGITWDDKDVLYASEHGPTRNDEINIIKKGSNYGWPLQEGNKNNTGFESPLLVYTEFTLAPSGIASYQNSIYVSGLRGSQLRRIDLSPDGQNILNDTVFLNNLGRIREVVYYAGYLYLSTSNRDGRGIPTSGDDKIVRIKL